MFNGIEGKVGDVIGLGCVNLETSIIRGGLVPILMAHLIRIDQRTTVLGPDMFLASCCLYFVCFYGVYTMRVCVRVRMCLCARECVRERAFPRHTHELKLE